MPSVSAGDGVEIHYEERGSGPLVVIGSYWSMHPSALEPLMAELESDHRVVRCDDRGTGQSTRSGPYDMATGAHDLAAVLKALGEPAVIVGVADAPSRAVRVAVADPDSIVAIVCPGGAPIGRESFERGETLATSESVVQALLQQVETDYRGALRSLVGSTNQQMDEDELRERIAAQAEHVPGETGAARLKAWAADDPLEDARAAGGKIWVLVSDGITGGWFPTGAELAKVVQDVLPEANVAEIADGWVSRPDETAAAVRRITASVQVPLTLRPAERIAALGAIAVAASLLLPWYGIELELFNGFSQTGLEAFGFAHAALLVSALAALALIWRCVGGYELPRPLGEGALLIAAGIWIALLVTYLAIDRPDEIAGFDRVRLRYGAFVALGGAAALVVGGARLRLLRPAREGAVV